MMNWIGIFAVGLALVMGGNGLVGLSMAEDQKKALLDLVKDRDQAIQGIGQNARMPSAKILCRSITN